MAYQRGGYYYRSRREGNRVVTEYLGRRSWVPALLRLETVEREQKAAERAAMRAEREAELEIDREIDNLGADARGLTSAVLLVSGYHTHKREWRRRQHGGRDSNRRGGYPHDGPGAAV